MTQSSSAKEKALTLLVNAKAKVHEATTPRVEWVPDVPDTLQELFRIDGMTDMPEIQKLIELATTVSRGAIVEVGSYRGRSTCALGTGSLAGQQAPVYAIEPHEVFEGIFGGEFGPQDRRVFYEAMLSTGCWEVVRLINLSSEVVAAGWDKPIELLFIDGDHSYEGVKRDYDAWRPHLLPGATVVFDDAFEEHGGPKLFITDLVRRQELLSVEEVGRMHVLRWR